MVKPGSASIKRPKRYKALREDGMSKAKAARISNAQAQPGRNPSARGGRRPPYEEWTVEQLYRQARAIGLDGRSGMNKAELIRALRNS